MMLLKRFHLHQTHDSQRSSDSPLAGGQDGSNEQDLDMRPHLLCEQRGKVVKKRANSLGTISIEDLLSS